MFPSPPTQESDNTTGQSPAPASQPSTPRRFPACGPCQQRKVKCERKFPCSSCVKAGAQCVPAPVGPRQRRRFPEKALLERLHRYEEIMRQNNLDFESVPAGPSKENSASHGLNSESQDADRPDSSSVYEAKDFWRTMGKGFRDMDEESNSSLEYMGETWAKDAWDQLYRNSGNSLLGIRTTNIDLSAHHPEPVQIFRLWQIYLDNVDPLFKVTHTPSLQPRIIEAMSNVRSINPNLEALMFSIYSISILTINEADCISIFGWTKDALLSRFYFSCEQALTNCGYLRTSNLDCLTALFLYLVSLGSSTDPRTLSSMLGIAMRLAKRMGFQIESNHSDLNALEAEQRRRLWWSILLYDSRIIEMVDSKSTELTPSWNCKIPLNINDSALRAETKDPPVADLKPTESLFIAVRAEMGNFMRHSESHLDYSIPAMKPMAKNVRDVTKVHPNVASLEKMIEEKYLKFCNLETPLHFMTVCIARGYMSRLKLFEQYVGSLGERSGPDRDTAVLHAFNMLENDTKVMASPLTQRYTWLMRIYFPLPAYIHIVRDLKTRPISQLSDRAWDVMADNYDARYDTMYSVDSRLFKFLTNFISQAWESRVKAFQKSGEPLATPRIVSSIQTALAQREQSEQDSNTDPNSIIADMGGLLRHMPTDMDPASLLNGPSWQDMNTSPPSDLIAEGPNSAFGPDVDQLDLDALALEFYNKPVWLTQ